MRFNRLFVQILCLIVMLAIAPSSAFAAAGDDTPSTPSPVKIARDLVKNEKYTEALTGLKKALAADPKNADLLSLTGFSHRKLRNLDKAYQYYNQALEINPEHKGALN